MDAGETGNLDFETHKFLLGRTWYRVIDSRHVRQPKNKFIYSFIQ